MNTGNYLKKELLGDVLLTDDFSVTMDVGDRSNRIWLCSVLFIDLVDYSKLSIGKQETVKTSFNQLLRESIANFSPNRLVIHDTGDGAAICFLGDPEEAFLTAMTFLNKLTETPLLNSQLIQARLGINLGPVKLIKDLNGNINTVGDGINVAQRVMNFAAPNQTLVSRGYYEVLTSVSEEYKNYFQFEGVRRDKHIREHSLYVLSPKIEAEPVAETVPFTLVSQSLAYSPELFQQLATFLTPVLGPLAQILIRKAFKTKTTWPEVIQNLQEVIPMETDQYQFRVFCQKISSELHPVLVSQTVSAPATVHEPEAIVLPSWELSVDLHARLEKELLNLIGPLAKIVIRQKTSQAKNLADLIQLLSKEIPNQVDQDKFNKLFKV